MASISPERLAASFANFAGCVLIHGVHEHDVTFDLVLQPVLAEDTKDWPRTSVKRVMDLGKLGGRTRAAVLHSSKRLLIDIISVRLRLKGVLGREGRSGIDQRPMLDWYVIPNLKRLSVIL